MKKKKAAEAAPKITLNHNHTSANNARAIIIRRLRVGLSTTIQLREQSGVKTAAQSIFKLNLRGHRITSSRVSGFTADGIKHRRVARYELLSQPKTANDDAIAPSRSLTDPDAVVLL